MSVSVEPKRPQTVRIVAVRIATSGPTMVAKSRASMTTKLDVTGHVTVMEKIGLDQKLNPMLFCGMIAKDQ
jgi:hypothetical protein